MSATRPRRPAAFLTLALAALLGPASIGLAQATKPRVEPPQAKPKAADPAGGPGRGNPRAPPPRPAGPKPKARGRRPAPAQGRRAGGLNPGPRRGVDDAPRDRRRLRPPDHRGPAAQGRRRPGPGRDPL